jgi:prepilin-type N-terminal cleavage/methylation domain-containing protein
MLYRQKKSLLGFTLIEIMIVVAIIGILAVVVAVSSGGSSASSRDAKRQADLRQLQSALETYKNRVGRYPAQCAATGPGADGWSGQLGTDFECDGSTGQYIVGLAPEYIPVLPIDPSPVSGQEGYVYRTNADGSVYKLMAMNTVEADERLQQANGTDLEGLNHPLRSCDVSGRINAGTGLVEAYLAAYSICHSIYNGVTYPTQPQCRENNARFQSSYGVWGGFASNDTAVSGLTYPLDNAERMTIRYTAEVICK